MNAKIRRMELDVPVHNDIMDDLAAGNEIRIDAYGKTLISVKGNNASVKVKAKPLYKFFKRLADILLSAFGLIVLSVPFLLIAILIKVTSKGPVIFRQQRCGLNKEPFVIYKFRTMTLEAPRNCATNEFYNAGCYITRVGKFLRSSSLDEIPQLFNILKGDMSFVGPRPVVFSEPDLIALRTKRGVTQIKPGLTGLAQINGRDCVDVEAKVQYDAEYLEKRSLWFDIKILAVTFIKVLRRDGVVDKNEPSQDKK